MDPDDVRVSSDSSKAQRITVTLEGSCCQSPGATLISLSNKKTLLGYERVGRDFQVEWCWSLTDSSTNIVVRSVAWAEPTIVFSGIRNRDTSQVRADGNHNNPLRIDDTFFVCFLVTKVTQWNSSNLLNFVGLSASNKDGLSSPLHSDGVTKLNIRKVKISSGQGSGRSRNAERSDALHNQKTSSRGVGKSDSCEHQIGECTSLGLSDLVDTVIIVASVYTSKLVQRWNTFGYRNIGISSSERPDRGCS